MQLDFNCLTDCSFYWYVYSCHEDVAEYLVEHHNLLDYVTEHYPDELRDKLGESEEGP